jgi:hypothetical protein
MMFVCSSHVKDALKIMIVPHVKLITEEETNQSSCHLCMSKARYKLYDYVHQTLNTKKAI